MEHYKEILKATTNGGNGEVKMWLSIGLVDELLDDLNAHHPEKYEEFMKKQHSVLFGNHYNEEWAVNDVAKMHHTNKTTGAVEKGEHFDMDKARSIYQSNKHKMHNGDNACDVYVAINANWHDKHNLFNAWFDDISMETNIIEDALSFYFLDDDAPNGKVYIYMNAIDAA